MNRGEIMVERILDSTLGNLDPTVLYICAAILVVMLILGIIKKVASVIIIALVLALGCIYLVPQVIEYQDNFSIGINEDKELSITVDGKEFTIDGNSDETDDPSQTISNVNIERQSNGWYELEIMYEDASKIAVNIPGFMRSPVLEYLDDQEIEYKLTE